ncbi:MAG: hypothetical protein M3R69_12670 [Acidobacteriota bacterium]|nr:hypothetical protein [Acidobacteriota bacterium]
MEVFSDCLSPLPLAVGGILVVLLSSATGLVLLGVSLAGLGLAPAFPTTIALFTKRN